jgi:hypothetical protein
MVSVDDGRCQEVAEILRAIHIPSADEDEPLVGLTTDTLPNFYLSIVAICHQTSPIGGVQLRGQLADGSEKFGWDYLRLRWSEQVIADPELNTPTAWARLEARDLARLLKDVKGASTLADAEGRAALLRDLGERLDSSGMTGAGDLLTAAQSRLEAESPKGLYRHLAAFRAYRDPVRKKSCFFLELMRSQCGWRYVDAENLGAPVDYHEIRGHLRVGTVVIRDSVLLEAIRTGREVTSEQDLAIRSAVYAAVQSISRSVGRTDAATLHYLFWNLFRRCCGRTNPHCQSCGESCGLPVRYRTAFAGATPNACLLSAVCASANTSVKLLEHLHTSDYY